MYICKVSRSVLKHFSNFNRKDSYWNAYIVKAFRCFSTQCFSLHDTSSIKLPQAWRALSHQTPKCVRPSNSHCAIIFCCLHLTLWLAICLSLCLCAAVGMGAFTDWFVRCFVCVCLFVYAERFLDLYSPSFWNATSAWLFFSWSSVFGCCWLISHARARTLTNR